MKLVNVSTLRRRLLALSDKYLKTNNFAGVLFVDDCIEVIDKMDKIENIDKITVAHWNCIDEDYNAYECSNCEDVFEMGADTPHDNNYHFCPNCGATMEVTE